MAQMDESAFERLVERLSVGVLVQGPRAEVLYCNARAAELLGLPATEIVGRTSLEASGFAIGVDGAPLPGPEHPGPRAIATGRAVRNIEVGWKRPDKNDRVWLLVTAEPETDDEGAVRRVVCTLVDVTAEHAEHEALRESEGGYRQLVEKAQDILYRTDAFGFFTYVNPVASRVMGYPEHEIVGKHFLELIREDHRDRVERRLRQQFKDQTPGTYDEFVAVTSGGDEMWIGQNVQLLVTGGRPVGFQAVARDITARKRAEAALLREREQLRHIVADAPAAMALFDRRGEVVAASARWREVWGASGAFPPRFRDALAKGLAGEVVVTAEEMVPREGGAGYLAWAVHPFRDETGAPEGVVAVVQDVDVLVRARETAEEAARLKSEFLANVSHELRTPLNGVLGMTRLLMQTTLEGRQREYVETIRDSGRALLQTVDDVLDYSRLEAGQLAIEPADVDPRALVEEALRVAGPAAARKKLRLTSVTDGDVPARLRGDPVRIRQALGTLLSNAVKFTDEGEVRTRIEVEGAGSDGVSLRFEVVDTGAGIAEDVRPRLFQPFVPAEGSTARRRGGAGLGLALCRRLVQAMGGEVGLTSTPGKGSRFWFTLPFARPASGATAAAPGRPAGVARARILVVEDNSVNQKVVTAMLRSLGYEAELAANGLEAVEACAKGDFDAILMDCQMPEMDGFRATAFIRQREGSERRTPIIALTASVMAEDRAHCLAAGMDDYLGKPVHVEALDATLRRWVGARAGDPPARPPGTLAPISPSGLDASHPLRILETQAGPRVFVEVVDVFLQTVPARLADMRDALRRKDAAALRALAHTLKGSTAQLGATGMADLCVQIHGAVRAGNLAGLLELVEALERDFASVREALAAERERVARATS